MGSAIIIPPGKQVKVEIILTEIMMGYVITEAVPRLKKTRRPRTLKMPIMMVFATTNFKLDAGEEPGKAGVVEDMVTMEADSQMCN